jgi:hypothetical protein
VLRLARIALVVALPRRDREGVAATEGRGCGRPRRVSSASPSSRIAVQSLFYNAFDDPMVWGLVCLAVLLSRRKARVIGWERDTEVGVTP